MSSSNTVFIVDYSERAIAVFGNIQPYESLFLEKGGKFNMSLTYEGAKRPGWVFSKKVRAVIEELINGIKCGSIKPENKQQSKSQPSFSSGTGNSDSVDTLRKMIDILSTRLERVEQELALTKSGSKPLAARGAAATVSYPNEEEDEEEEDNGENHKRLIAKKQK